MVQHHLDIQTYEAWEKKNINALIHMALDMWLALRNKFDATSLTKLCIFIIKFDTFKKRVNVPMPQHLCEMSNMNHKL